MRNRMLKRAASDGRELSMDPPSDSGWTGDANSGIPAFASRSSVESSSSPKTLIQVTGTDDDLGMHRPMFG